MRHRAGAAIGRHADPVELAADANQEVRAHQIVEAGMQHGKVAVAARSFEARELALDPDVEWIDGRGGSVAEALGRGTGAAAESSQ